MPVQIITKLILTFVPNVWDIMKFRNGLRFVLSTAYRETSS